MERAFWMVYGMNQGAPTARHISFEVAKTEAERLARQHPGIEFYVMQPVSRSKRVDVETEMLVPDDQIPF